jgi:glyoxylase-like metal-dependent hydrolase (beta-lactamase superfamily II)
MKKISCIIRVPDEPGSLQRAARIIKKNSGNINRLQFDRRIDPCTVFIEITTYEDMYDLITRDLAETGYLQTSVTPLNYLKFSLSLPHEPGALYDFLNYTTSASANIAFIDFNDKGRHPDLLTVSLNLEQGKSVDQLLDKLKSRYRMEILEYDTTGKHLDDTVFYVRYAQAVREITGESEDGFLLSFLADSNYIAQELMGRGSDPRLVFESVLSTGRTMRDTTGDRFYADIQEIPLGDAVTLYCFQVPCGGNVFIIKTPDEKVMIDTGYGIYNHDILIMLNRHGLLTGKGISRIIITHADADHCGAAGYFSVPVYMHQGTLEIIQKNNRAYRSRSENSILEEFYTKMINLFSKFKTPVKVDCFAGCCDFKRGIFPVIGKIRIGSLDLEVLEGLGGHIYGQIYLYSENYGVLFSADSLINFASLTKERADYSSLAAFLVTSVNVDSDLARTERNALLELVQDTDNLLRKSQKCCLICGGHGAVSVLKNDKMVIFGDIERYLP